MSHEIRLRIELPEGLHARPANQIVEFLNAHNLSAEIRIDENRHASGNSVLELMLLGAHQGDSLVFSFNRPLDENQKKELSMLVGETPSD